LLPSDTAAAFVTACERESAQLWRSPAVLLLRALGDLLLDEEMESVDDMDALAIMSGIVYIELPTVVQAAIAADYVEEDDDCSIGLTKRGWAWFRWNLEKHRGGGM
jgi:hypothetical protein